MVGHGAFGCRRLLRKPSLVAAADTRDVAGTVAEVKRCVDAGAEIVRITVQGKKEAAACMAIREALFKDRCAPPQRGRQPAPRPCARLAPRVPMHSAARWHSPPGPLDSVLAGAVPNPMGAQVQRAAGGRHPLPAAGRHDGGGRV